MRRAIDSRFATMFYGVLSENGVLTYSNAGHNPPFLIGRTVRRLTAGGLILGAFNGAKFEEETVQLNPDDLLVVFSDGVTEALNADGVEFGEERLLACVTGHRNLAPASLLRCVLDTVHDFTGKASQNDDLTVMVLRYGSS
jgi:sigma-B regulation protein RsbU (phosphoserine phosphatase)